MHIRTVIAVVLLVAAACVPKADPGAGTGATPSASRSATNDGSPRPSGNSTSTSGPSSGATPPTSGGPAPARYDDDGGVGQMARAYLRANPATRLVVEVDFVEDSAPRQDALDHLKDVLEDVTSKPGGVVVRRDDPIPEQDGSHSFQDIARLEARYRDQRSAGSTATLWLVYLNGSLQGEQGTLGVAFKASSAAVFPDGIESAATALVQAGAIERSVVTHEVGHLLGLVNLVQRSAYDHEDPDHPKHSKYKSSVMYWAIEDISIASLLSGGPPDNFDQYDRADLAALRTG